LTLPELIDLAERLSETPPTNARDVRDLLQSIDDNAALNSNDLFCQIARGMLRVDEERFGQTRGETYEATSRNYR